MQYLLDTNICIYLFKGKFNLDKKIIEKGLMNCAISEITYAELIFGAENSEKKEANLSLVENFASKLAVLPIFDGIKIYAKEKIRLRKEGKIISDFDLLIGATAIAHQMIMVTRNVSEFSRLSNIKIEDWTI